MTRLNTERQNKLEPIRMQIAINEILRLGLRMCQWNPLFYR